MKDEKTQENKDTKPQETAVPSPVQPVVYQGATKKPPYRPLNPKERDTLFAYYDKHNGNMLAMTRDVDCQFKSYNQLKYYCNTYFFCERLDEIRLKRATKVIEGLKDSKILAIQRAVGLIETRQVPLKNTKGDVLLDRDGQPIFVEITPDHKEVEAAWKIIKTELGEPTQIGKQDLTTKGEKIQGGVQVTPEQEARIFELFGRLPAQVEVISQAKKENDTKPTADTKTPANNGRGASIPQGSK
jgi:hypothetical protein